MNSILEKKNFSVVGLIFFIFCVVCGFVLPIRYSFYLPEVVMFFPGILFFTCGISSIRDSKKIWVVFVVILMSLIAIIFGISEILKNPVLSDGFNVFTFMIIIVIILLILSIIISILSRFIKKKWFEYLPFICCGIATFLYAVVLEYIISFMNL